jgi:hypothetical protein
MWLDQKLPAPSSSPAVVMCMPVLVSGYSRMLEPTTALRWDTCCRAARCCFVRWPWLGWWPPAVICCCWRAAGAAGAQRV